MDISWEEGRLREVLPRSDLGRPCAVRQADRFDTRPAGEYRLDGQLGPL